MNELFLIGDIVAVDTFEGLAEIGVFAAESADDVFDLFSVEPSVVDDRAVGVIGSKNTVGTEVDYTLFLLEQHRDNGFGVRGIALREREGLDIGVVGEMDAREGLTKGIAVMTAAKRPMAMMQSLWSIIVTMMKKFEWMIEISIA